MINLSQPLVCSSNRRWLQEGAVLQIEQKYASLLSYLRVANAGANRISPYAT